MTPYKTYQPVKSNYKKKRKKEVWDPIKDPYHKFPYIDPINKKESVLNAMWPYKMRDMLKPYQDEEDVYFCYKSANN